MTNTPTLTPTDIERIKKAKEEIARTARAREDTAPPRKVETDETHPEPVQLPLPHMPPHNPAPPPALKVDVLELLSGHRERILGQMTGVSKEFELVNQTLSVLKNLAIPCPNQITNHIECPYCKGEGQVRPTKVEATVG